MSIIQEILRIQTKNWFSSNNFLVERKDGFFPYWRYRILRPLIKVQYKTFRFLNRPAPWLSPAATVFLKKHLTKEMMVAEFGSGISTLFLAPKVKKLVSVEHNETWYNMISDKLKKMQLSNVDYKFIAQQDSLELDTEPIFIKAFDIDQKVYAFRKDYVNYFSALDEYQDESFDVVIVDGRARPECVFSSFGKLKKDGLMVLDNSERKRYEIVFEKLKHLESVTTTNGLTDTTFWQKA